VAGGRNKKLPCKSSHSPNVVVDDDDEEEEVDRPTAGVASNKIVLRGLDEAAAAAPSGVTLLSDMNNNDGEFSLSSRCRCCRLDDDNDDVVRLDGSFGIIDRRKEPPVNGKADDMPRRRRRKEFVR
jgi:hypothetical protein